MTDPLSDLLTNPPGSYGLTPQGSTHAVVLRGSDDFRDRAYGFFTSMGVPDRMRLVKGRPVPFEPPLPPRHQVGDEVEYFCLPAHRVKLALRLWLYARLWKAAARDVLDAEGDYLDTVCDDEARLWDETEQPAIEFIVAHMPPDWKTVESDEWAMPSVEHSMGALDRGGDE